jgi:L-malate glycosyltransferase
VRTFHQVIVGAGPGDAITQMALEIRKDFRALGTSEIFARFIDPAMAEEVSSLNNLPSGRPSDVIIYHASFGDPEVTKALLRRPERLVLVYHNITPSTYFIRHEPHFAAGLEWGRHELSLLRDRTALAAAVSHFNANELRTLGFEDVHVVTAGLRPARLTAVAPSSSTLATLNEVIGDRPFVLNVSQQLPHKRQHVLIQALHLLQSVHGADFGLVLAGAERSATYCRALRRLAVSLRVRNIWFAGRLSDAGLATLYRSANSFASASTHEGLGIPPLEAMSFGLPTVVCDAAATAETVAGASLLLPVDAGPLLFAEAVLAANEDEGLRSTMICAGLERVATLTSAIGSNELARLLDSAGLAR